MRKIFPPTPSSRWWNNAPEQRKLGIENRKTNKHVRDGKRCARVTQCSFLKRCTQAGLEEMAADRQHLCCWLLVALMQSFGPCCESSSNAIAPSQVPLLWHPCVVFFLSQKLPGMVARKQHRTLGPVCANTWS